MIMMFEMYKTVDYYQRIGSVDSNVRSMGIYPNYSNLVRFTDREKRRIIDNIPKNKEQSRRVVDNIIVWDNHYCCLKIDKGFNEWTIYRWGTDDWIWAYNDYTNIPYRCDGLEGLFRLLKDKWK